MQCHYLGHSKISPCPACKEETNPTTRELLLLASTEFANKNRTDFIEFLKANHPYLHQVYISVEGEG